jgi:hypothetical protein
MSGNNNKKKGNFQRQLFSSSHHIFINYYYSSVHVGIQNERNYLKYDVTVKNENNCGMKINNHTKLATLPSQPTTEATTKKIPTHHKLLSDLLL